MKKNSILFLAFLLIGLLVHGQDEPKKGFEESFLEAKKLLYDFHPEKALPIFLDLYKEHPENHNLEYLIGACYTDYEPGRSLSIAYLEKAKPFVIEDYNADSPDEKNASIHLYYFLAVAYAQNGRCDEAETTNEHFHTLIGKIGHAYLRDAQFWVDACRRLQKDAKAQAAVAQKKDPNEKDPNEIKNNKIVTQSVEYNTPAPLYGVQVGSFSKFLPSGSFDDIKNVDAFIDKSGKVRYVVGNFSFRNQAETLQKVLEESGYADAFIVDVNKERRFTNKIISVNDISIKNQIRGKVHFRCQIGAFRDTIPESMARKYIQVNGIKENVLGDMTLLSVGHFATYEEAKAYVSELAEQEINDAFVVAYNYDQKVPIKSAMTYLSKQAESSNDKKKKKK